MELQMEEPAVIELVTNSPKPQKVNKQLYENSAQAKAQSEVDDIIGASKLYGQRDPTFSIEHEKPEHRLILLAKFNGMSNREIARKTGYTESWISQVCRQPWFVQQFTLLCQDAGFDSVQKMLEVEGPASVAKLVELRDSADSDTVRASCAIKILEYNIGKPTQKVEHAGAIMHGVVHLDKINQELAELEAEERSLLSNGRDITES